MKIALLSDSLSGINFFPELGKKLSGQIADAEMEEHFVSSMEDLPFKAKEAAEYSDVIFVFFARPEKSRTVEMVMEKLVDVELETGKKVIKAFEALDAEELSTEKQFGEEKRRLAEKWAGLIVKTLFKPEELAPKDGKSDEQFEEEGSTGLFSDFFK